MEFQQWMETALYDKTRGYYTTRLESVPDYVTAPNFGPYLGQAIAQELGRAWQLLPAMAQPKVFTLVEAGCGSEASLSLAILDTLAAGCPELFGRLQVILVERSIPRLSAAIAHASRRYPGKVFGCPEISQIPKIWGAVVSNELLDALPVRLLRRTPTDQVEEGYVETGATQAASLEWKECKDPVAVSFGLDLPVGTPYALNARALQFLEQAADRLEHGLILTIDYGDERPVVFERSALKAFTQGAVKLPDFNKPGSEDLTSPVDFTLLMDWGSRSGLDTMHYEALGSFLIRNGIGEMLSSQPERKAIENNLRIKALIHPSGFGEDFKVLIQGK